MPVGFLTAEQQRRYGRFVGEPSPAQLARFFYLTESDLEMVRRRRGNHNRLGFAVLLGSVRFLGTFPQSMAEVPPVVMRHLAAQLGITDPRCIEEYATRDDTLWEHRWRSRRPWDIGISTISLAAGVSCAGSTREPGSMKNVLWCCSTWRPLVWSRNACCCPAHPQSRRWWRR